MKMGFKIYIILILLVAGVYDWKSLSIPVWTLAAGVLGGVVGAIYGCYGGNENLWSVLVALVPGIALLILAYLTKEQVGYGDGVLMLGMGGCMGGISLLYALMLALFAIFLVSMALVICRKVKLQTKLPFAPFLAMGSILVVGGMFLG